MLGCGGSRRSRCSGARVLDLFAGTGALGIEALSRGAVSSVFVERANGPLAALRLNIEACGFGERAEVRRGDALRELTRLARAERRFDLVFLDPPYGEGLERRALEALTRHELLAEGACLAVETAAAGDDPGEGAEALSLEKTRTYGETAIWLYRAVGRSDC
jgi:16S rRNA (guanine966-N2)-methyltransferase